MSGSSLDGLDICFVEFDEIGGKWTYEIKESACLPFSTGWNAGLQSATQLNARDYMRLHTAFGHYIGEQVNLFIEGNNLQHRVQLIVSHGHTTFHEPAEKMTGQIGDGAAIAAVTGINVVSDLRAMDIALGGQGAPIVPIGEKLLLGDYDFFLNLGGIANISYAGNGAFTAFDICPANRVLNMLVQEMGHDYDDGGGFAASGSVDEKLLAALNSQPFYAWLPPKSLANSYGTDIIYPLVKNAGLSVPDALRTVVEHIAVQIRNAVENINQGEVSPEKQNLLITGGGAFNEFLVSRIAALLEPLHIAVEVPDATLVNFKEALVMALIGVLRWREENNILHTVTGASRSSIGGAVWIGQQA